MQRRGAGDEALLPRLHQLRGGFNGGARQRSQQSSAVGTSQARAGIPIGTGLITGIVTAGDVSEGRTPDPIQGRVEEAKLLADVLVEQRNQAGPERSYGTGSSDHQVGSVHVNLVSG